MLAHFHAFNLMSPNQKSFEAKGQFHVFNKISEYEKQRFTQLNCMFWGRYLMGWAKICFSRSSLTRTMSHDDDAELFRFNLILSSTGWSWVASSIFWAPAEQEWIKKIHIMHFELRLEIKYLGSGKKLEGVLLPEYKIFFWPNRLTNTYSWRYYMYIRGQSWRKLALPFKRINLRSMYWWILWQG